MKMTKRGWQTVQFVIAMLLTLMISFTVSDLEEELLTLKGFMLYIPIALWFIQVLAFGFETQFKSNRIRMVYLIISSFLILLFIFETELAAAISMVMSIGYLIMMLIVYVKGGNTGVIITGKVSEKTLPLGHFSKKHSRFTYFSFILAFVLAFCSYLLCDNILHIDGIMSFIITFIFVFVFIIAWGILFNPFSKVVNKFNKDLDFVTFEKGILEMLDNNLHPDSRSHLNVLYANYLYTYDLCRGIELFNKIERPEYKAYRLFYDIVAINNAANEKNEEKAYELLESFKIEHSKYQQHIISLSRLLTIVFTSDEIQNIEAYYPLNNRVKINNIINANTLMSYYSTRNNLEKAKYYAKYLLDNNQTLLQLIAEAEAVMARDE